MNTKAIRWLWLISPLLLFASLLGSASAQVVGQDLCSVSSSGTLACSSSINAIANGVNANTAASIFQLSNLGYLMTILLGVIIILAIIFFVLRELGFSFGKR